jgi:hypothetical protein
VKLVGTFEGNYSMKLNRIVEGEARRKIDMSLRKVGRNLSMVKENPTAENVLVTPETCESEGSVCCSQVLEYSLAIPLN